MNVSTISEIEMSDTIVGTTTTEITASVKDSVIPSKIGSDDFCKKIVEELKKKSWRTSTSLATILKVDKIELENWLDKNPEIARKPGKEDGSVFYGMLVAPKEKTKIVNPLEIKVSPEERYVLAQLDLITNMAESFLEKSCMVIVNRDEEILSHLTKAIKHLKSGLALYDIATKAPPSRVLFFN